MKSFSILSLLTATLFSVALSAQAPDPSVTPSPTPTPPPMATPSSDPSVGASPSPSPTPDQDPNTPNRTQVICGGSMTFASAQEGATHDSNSGNIFKLDPVANSADKRLQTSGVVGLQNNHEFEFTLTAIPKASRLVSGEDLLTMSVRYQRHDGDKIKVLAETIVTSDQLSSFSELNARRSDLSVNSQFSNPEISTVLANLDAGATIQDAIRLGQLPDGITTKGSFNCRMHVGRSIEFR